MRRMAASLPANAPGDLAVFKTLLGGVTFP